MTIEETIVLLAAGRLPPHDRVRALLEYIQKLQVVAKAARHVAQFRADVTPLDEPLAALDALTPGAAP